MAYKLISFYFWLFCQVIILINFNYATYYFFCRSPFIIHITLTVIDLNANYLSLHRRVGHRAIKGRPWGTAARPWIARMLEISREENFLGWDRVCGTLGTMFVCIQIGGPPIRLRNEFPRNLRSQEGFDFCFSYFERYKISRRKNLSSFNYCHSWNFDWFIINLL